MGRSQVAYNRSHRNRGSKGRGGRGGAGKGRGGGDRGGEIERKTAAKDQQEKHVPLGDNNFRYEQDPYTNDDGDENIFEGTIDLNAYGPSHDAVTLKSEQRVIDDNVDNYAADANEKSSGGIYDAGGEISSALSKLSASVWMKLPKEIGERVDLSMGKSTVQKRKHPKKKNVQLSMGKVLAVEMEETKVDDAVLDNVEEDSLAKAMGEKCDVSETKNDKETDKMELSDIVIDDEEDNNITQEEKDESNEDDDEEEGGEEDLDAWLDSVIA